MARTTPSRSRGPRATTVPPLRISVVGASVTYMCEPFEDGGHRGPYPLQLREELIRRGVPVELNQWNRWYGMVTHTWDVYERVRDSNPDVVILNFGLAECEPRFVPNRIIAHLLGWRRSTATVPMLYRRTVARVLWRIARRWQRWSCATFGQRTHRLPPRRFVEELRRLITVLERETGALILLIDIDRQGERYTKALPGIQERVEHYNRLLVEVVDMFGDRVRLMNASASCDRLPAEEWFDGRHRTPLAHAETAQLLADEVTAWLEQAESA